MWSWVAKWVGRQAMLGLMSWVTGKYRDSDKRTRILLVVILIGAALGWGYWRLF